LTKKKKKVKKRKKKELIYSRAFFFLRANKSIMSYACAKCPRTFKSQNSLNTHAKVHQVTALGRRKRCSKKKGDDDDDDTIDAMRTINEDGREIYRCKGCGHALRSFGAHVNHLRTCTAWHHVKPQLEQKQKTQLSNNNNKKPPLSFGSQALPPSPPLSPVEEKLSLVEKKKKSAAAISPPPLLEKSAALVVVPKQHTASREQTIPPRPLPREIIASTVVPPTTKMMVVRDAPKTETRDPSALTVHEEQQRCSRFIEQSALAPTPVLLPMEEEQQHFFRDHYPRPQTNVHQQARSFDSFLQAVLLFEKCHPPHSFVPYR
jgi:hypothetical protein